MQPVSRSSGLRFTKTRPRQCRPLSRGVYFCRPLAIRLRRLTFREISHRAKTLRISASSDFVTSAKPWAGRKIEFMQSNDHPRERQGKWDSSGLEGAAKHFVEEDKHAGSWLKKLQVVKNALVSDMGESEPDIDALAVAHIYLSWTSQGILPCVEAGGHYRPKHHADTAKAIFRQLEQNIDIHRDDTEVTWLSREIHSKLPSFADEFRRAEPLTRIRDIAHRNDIPKDMKHEIKHTLQNKLHRNAGPEDLVAAELMYERILSQQDDLNPDFVKQYGLFMSELREFFNAGNLAEALRNVRRSMQGVDESGVQIINRMLELQSELDDSYQTHASFEKQSNRLMETMHAVTTVRALLLSKLSSGLRNDAPDNALVMRQCYRLAEIRSEQYIFVLMSRFINLLDDSQIYDQLAAGNDRSWALPLGALVLGLRNVAMTGWASSECVAIENELAKWHKLGYLSKPANALRMRATLERLQRLASQFCDTILNAFANNAKSMGEALGVSGHHAAIYSESEIRASVVFQVSKLTSILLKAARHAAGQTAWDTLVPGVARGRVVEVNSIDSIALPAHVTSKDKLILVVKRATGDEDVEHLTAGFSGKKGMKVTGIVLCQELPHLSHLGVRARQERLIFATCTDKELVQDEIGRFYGDYIELSALPDRVVIEAVHGGENEEESKEADQKWTPKHQTSKAAPVVPSIEEARETIIAQHAATTETCGSKAANCAVIAEIAQRTESFSSPSGVCIPFGVMETTLSERSLKEIEQLLVEINHRLDNSQDIRELAAEIHTMITNQSVSREMLKRISESFADDQKVIVRSSANIEDLAGMSGAGLHDSVNNVDPHDPEDLTYGILCVWASLYTRRALMARHASGLPHAQARMAILIQEQLYPSLSFVLHTTDPVTKNSNILSAEIAPGIGETLASGTRGTPWRLTVDKRTSEVETKAFANFSSILMPKGTDGPGWKPAEKEHEGALMIKVADYSDLALSVDDENRELLGKRLATVGDKLVSEFGNVPQDVEGALVGNTIYIVQSRPQPI